jgi:D-arabinose 1-dehydrogenase-like Zn-dependent alcohol dehydrogenase
MTKTYRAIEVSSPGVMKLVERPLPEPGKGQVRIRVTASGICHTDAVTVQGVLPNMPFPRVPGHEIAGTIEAIGDGVEGLALGQRVGVGWFGGQCGKCEPCRRGDLVSCANLIVPGITTDGGYAEVVLAEARAVAIIPKGVSDEAAAPLLCAGVTTYNALRNAGLRAGDTVAIQGIGGLGHLAVQFARRMGFFTIAIARGSEKEKLARELGAHEYIDATLLEPAEALRRLGGANAVVTTASGGKDIGALIAGLVPRGKLIVVGAGAEPIQISSFPLLSGSRSVLGTFVGTAIDSEDTMRFSARERVRPVIETVSLERAPEAYEKMMRNAARFRMVITF